METFKPESRGHVRYLDGLRGIAILMVVMVHVSLMVYLPGVLHGFAAYGVRGVQLFFIVSGLTLTMSHLDRHFYIANFAARRFFRISPMFYIALIFYFTMGHLTNLPFMRHDSSAGDAFLTIFFLHDWSLTANNKVVPGGWSIACEAMFYSVFPVLIILLRKLRNEFWILLIIIYALSGMTYIAIQHFIPSNPDLVKEFARNFWLTQLPAFASGCWIALGVGYTRTSSRQANVIAVAAVVLLFIDSQMRGKSNLLVAIGLLSALVWACGRARPAILESRPMTYLGEISFSVYLIHFFMAGLVSFFAPWLQERTGAVFAFPILLAATLGLTIPIAACTFQLIEKPFIAYSRRLFRPNAASELSD